MDQVVIVGAGQAGGWAAATIRDLQPDRPILIIGAEDHPPYERPPLSKGVLLGQASPQSTYLKPRSYYSENGIALELGTQVTRIDRTNRFVELSSGQTRDYGTLVISTGVRPRQLPVPGGDHERVVYLRSLADLPAIQSQFVPGRHIVKIGAGFIGLEAAAAAAVSGCRVTVIEWAPHALNRVMAAEVAEAIVARHRAHGVTFMFDEQVAGISDSSGRARVQTGGGESLVADLVLCGIGGIPNDALAQDAGLACADGVLVDETGLTSDPSIYAVGDVSQQMSLALGRRVRLESWQNAQNQAIAVGRRIAGTSEPYDELPWFWTDQYDFNFQMIGLPEQWDRIVWRGAPAEEKFTAIYLEGDRVVGGNTMNNARDIRPLKQMIKGRTPVDAELLTDTSVSLIKIHKMQASQ